MEKPWMVSSRAGRSSEVNIRSVCYLTRVCSSSSSVFTLCWCVLAARQSWSMKSCWISNALQQPTVNGIQWSERPEDTRREQQPLHPRVTVPWLSSPPLISQPLRNVDSKLLYWFVGFDTWPGPCLSIERMSARTPHYVSWEVCRGTCWVVLQNACHNPYFSFYSGLLKELFYFILVFLSNKSLWALGTE